MERTQAVVTFTTDGVVTDANKIFLDKFGHTREEVLGQHHRLFVEPKEAGRPEYAEFWRALGEGTAQQGEFKRIAKSGETVWLSSTYTPIRSPSGRVIKVVKFAQDVTAEKLRNADFEGQIAAIGRTQAVVTFATDSTILEANEQFLVTMGYTREEVVSEWRGVCVCGSDFSKCGGRLGRSTACLWTT